ncbi:hypothetical protein ACWC5I_20020, partial [Kitasatospora sp. NPDC001574]
MSMLAERAAQTQAAPGSVAGTAGQDARLCAERSRAEEARQARAEGRWALRSQAERDRARPELTDQTPQRAVSSGYTTGPKVRLCAAVDSRLTDEQADQIGRLFSLHHAQLVRYVLRRMIRPDWA